MLMKDVPVVLPPISTKGLTPADVDDLARTTRDLMLRELQALTETPAGQAAQYPKNHTSTNLPSEPANYKTAADPRPVVLENKFQADGAAMTSGADARRVRDAL